MFKTFVFLFFLSLADKSLPDSASTNLLIGQAGATTISCSAQIIPEPLPHELKKLSKNAMENIYAIHLDDAEKNFEEIIKKYPEHPIGYFGRAMTKWARLEYEHEESNPALDSEFNILIDTAVQIGLQWVENHKYDANAFMCLGGAYGLRARLYLMQHKWLKAYFDGKKGIKKMKTALKIDPELYDAYIGLGMYEYYAGTLSGIIGILAKLFISGDAQKGIEYLTLTKEKGFFNAMAAELVLIEIFTQTNSPYSNSSLAVTWSKELRQKYQYHPMLHFTEIVALFENKQWQDVRKEAMDYLKYIEEGRPLYQKIYVPRALLALGTSFLAENDFDNALEYFLKASETLKGSGQANRWAVWAQVRTGNVYDLKGDREKALKYYNEALSCKDEWGFKEYIKKYTSKPYTLKDLPGALPPP
ncbi:MAG: tetratricopeptide repeat protein [Elusimicrobiota bacterium]